MSQVGSVASIAICQDIANHADDLYGTRRRAVAVVNQQPQPIGSRPRASREGFPL
jgi:hypothetical protein